MRSTTLKISLFLTLLAALPLQAQRFWLTTYEFTGGPKMGITSIRDSVLLVATHQGVMRSFNQGNSWETTLTTNEIYSISSEADGKVMVGGNGKIFHSSNFGQSWDSTDQLGNFPFVKIIFTKTGNAMAITYDAVINGPEGSGVWWWNKTTGEWSRRNAGLGDNWGCDQLAIALDGRIFLTVFDEWRNNGGLYVTSNEGLLWTYVPISFHGRNVVENQCQVYFTTNLSLSSDSIYMSFHGKAGLAGIRLNLVKALSDVNNTTPWHQYRIGSGPTFWMDKLLNGIHFAQNGDRYSSHSGSFEQGGTYFYKQNTWSRTVAGLGGDVLDRFGYHHFTEFSNGKVFMVQYLDERIYWADTSLRTVTHVIQPKSNSEVLFSPNPILDSKLTLSGFAPGMHTLIIRNMQGKAVHRQTFNQADATLKIDLPSKGIYLVEVDDLPLKNKLIYN